MEKPVEPASMNMIYVPDERNDREELVYRDIEYAISDITLYSLSDPIKPVVVLLVECNTIGVTINQWGHDKDINRRRIIAIIQAAIDEHFSGDY